MYKLCSTQKSQERQSRIEQELLNMMGKQPYKDITISALCIRADIPRKTFYRYFDSKDDVLHALIDHTEEQYLYASLDSDSTLFSKLYIMFSYWYDNREFLDAIVKNQIEKLWYVRAIDIMTREGIGKKYTQQLRNDFDYNLITIFTVSGTLSCILYVHKEGWLHSPQELANIVSGFLISPPYRE